MQIETDGKVVVITSEGITVTGQLISGAFPRWRDAVPDRKGTHPSTISREALIHGVRQAAIVTSEQSKGVEFTFGKSLKLTAQSSEAGQSSVTVDLEDSGDAGTVKLDPKFVVDFVKTLDTDHPAEVTMSIGQRGDAVVLKCDDVTGVIMPLAE